MRDKTNTYKCNGMIYFLTRLAIRCNRGFTVLLMADNGLAGAGDGGAILLFCVDFCSFTVCSLAPLKKKKTIKHDNKNNKKNLQISSKIFNIN